MEEEIQIGNRQVARPAYGAMSPDLYFAGEMKWVRHYFVWEREGRFILLRTRAHRNDNQRILTLNLKFLIILLLKLVHVRYIPCMGLGDSCLGKRSHPGVVGG